MDKVKIIIDGKEVHALIKIEGMLVVRGSQKSFTLQDNFTDENVLKELEANRDLGHPVILEDGCDPHIYYTPDVLIYLPKITISTL